MTELLSLSDVLHVFLGMIMPQCPYVLDLLYLSFGYQHDHGILPLNLLYSDVLNPCPCFQLSLGG